MTHTTPFRQRSLLGIAITACLAAGAVQAQNLNAPDARISDQAIVADHAVYGALQQRIKGLNDKGLPLSDYFLSKAQCWLDVSLHEYTRNDRSAFPSRRWNRVQPSSVHWNLARSPIRGSTRRW